MLTAIKNKMKKKNISSRGSEENYIRNGALVLEESISLFHGRTNYLLRHFSIDDLNSMNLIKQRGFYGVLKSEVYQGCFDGRVVFIDICCNSRYPPDVSSEGGLHEIVVASEMGTHNNVHKLLGCCLQTTCPVLIYEWVGTKTLQDCIITRDGDQNKQLLEWKDRLRIAWEISHAVAYLHTAFPRPIIHRDLKASSILLDENNSVKLRDFSVSVSLPEGEEFVETDRVIGTHGYMAPEYWLNRIVSEGVDVYSFGVLLLVLLTGKRPYDMNDMNFRLVRKWVRNGVKDNIISDIVAPTITKNGVTTIEDLQLRASIQLALLCCAGDADTRPTMVEVATKLKNMITSPESIPTFSTFHVPFNEFYDHGTDSDTDFDDQTP